MAATDEAGFASSLVRVREPAVPALLDALPALRVPAVSAEATMPAAERDPLAASLGSLAHLYLEMMARDGLERWSAQRIRELQPAMTAWLINQGNVQAVALQGAKQLSEALTATLESESGRWVLRPRPDAAAELALSSSNADGSIATHVVDRTFIENGKRWIIDYKLVRHEGGGLDTFLHQRAEEYRPQLERYATLFADERLPLRKGIYFIAQGQLVELG